MKRKTYLKHATIYQVYVRNHTKKGTFKALKGDLKRIKDLGVDILYLLPIHPIGEISRKGKLGSPYAIKDYYGINEELGNLDDFKSLLATAHDLELSVMIDIVLHHTSPDSVLLKEHPDFYFYKNGKPGNKVGDWSDIIDLDYQNRELWDYMLEMLTYWADLGVDGFRADVAPLIPLEFWKYVRTKLDEKYPELLWLSESVEPGFLTFLHENGHVGHSDAEMYEAFDMLYDYDVYPDFKAYLAGEKPLSLYIEGLKAQEVNYPKGYLKIRTIENHDTSRIAELCDNEQLLYNVTAWSFIQEGVGFIYGGQEVKAMHRPTLFDKDTIDLTVHDQKFYKFIQNLVSLKLHPNFGDDLLSPRIDTVGDIIQVLHHIDGRYALCYINLTKEKVMINVLLPEGKHKNLLGGEIEVSDGKFELSGPVIFFV